MKTNKSKSKNKKRRVRGKPVSIPTKELKRRNVNDRILKIGLPSKYKNVMIDDTKHVIKYKKDKDRLLKKKKEAFYAEQKERIKKLVQEEEKLQEFTRNGLIHAQGSLGKRAQPDASQQESRQRVRDLKAEIKGIKDQLRRIRDLGKLQEFKKLIRSSTRKRGANRLKFLQETSELNQTREALRGMPVKFRRDEQGRIFDIHNNPVSLTANNVSSVGANQEKFRNEKIRAILKYRNADLRSDYGDQVFDANIKEARSSRRRKTASGLGFAMSRNSRRPRRRVEDMGGMRHIRHTGRLSKYSIQKNTYQRRPAEGPVPDVEWWDEPLINFTTENYMTPHFIKDFKRAHAKQSQARETLFEDWLGNDIELRLHLMDDLRGRRDMRKVVKDLDALNLLCKDNIKRLPRVLATGEVRELREYQTRDEARRSKRERKLAAMREIQEKVKYGLVPPPEPKLKLSNFMSVLKEEAVQDPTKVELLVRKAIDQRHKKHLKHNQKRKAARLSNKEKRRRKSVKDMAKKALLSVYRVADLSGFENQYKVNVNAKKFFLKGFCMVPAKFLKDLSGVIVTVAGDKYTRKFEKLLQKRIKWGPPGAGAAAPKPEDSDDDDDFDFLDEGPRPDAEAGEQVKLVWRGITDRVIEQDWGFFKVNTRKDYAKIFENYQMTEFMETLRK